MSSVEIFVLLIGFRGVPSGVLGVEIRLSSIEGSVIKIGEVGISRCLVGERVDLRVERVDAGVFTADTIVFFRGISDTFQSFLPRSFLSR